MEQGRHTTAGVGDESSHTAAVFAAELERLVEENRRLYEHIGRLTHSAWLEEEAERTRQEAEEFLRQSEEARRKDRKARAEAERIRREEAEKARRAEEEAEKVRRAAREAEEARVREEQRKRREAAEEAREREAERRRREDDARRKADEAQKAKEREADRLRKAEKEKRAEAERARQAEWQRRWRLTPREKYEEDWQNITAGKVPEQFTFSGFPWPLSARPGCHHEEEFQASKIEKFLALADLRTNSERCKAIRKELTRWHPDKFHTRVHTHIYGWDKERINAAAVHVGRALVQLLEKFSQS